METNTVLLSLSDYNELREFKENMEKYNVYKLSQPYSNPFSCLNYQLHIPLKYITTDEAIIELLERNNQLSEMHDKLAIECDKLKRETISKEKISKMSIWEFIKWRKNL